MLHTGGTAADGAGQLGLAGLGVDKLGIRIFVVEEEDTQRWRAGDHDARGVFHRCPYRKLRERGRACNDGETRKSGCYRQPAQCKNKYYAIHAAAMQAAVLKEWKWKANNCGNGQFLLCI